MLAHFYMKFKKELKLIAHVGVPDNIDTWYLEITQMIGVNVVSQKVRFKKIKGTALVDDEAMFLYDADLELKGQI